MGLKTASRARRKSRRSPQQYITNPKTIQRIANTVDAAARQAPDGTVRSFADFKQMVEDYSEATPAPLGVELCEVDGAVRGFRFYLQSEPEKTITGKYLAIGTDQESDSYTPATVAQFFGFDPDPDERNQPHDEPEDEFDDDPFADDDVDDAIDSSTFPSQSIATAPDSSVSPYAAALEQLDHDEWDDIWDEAESASPESSASSNHPYRRRTQPLRSTRDQLLTDASYAAQRVASQGSDLNGINLVGAALVGGVAAATVAGLALDELEQQRLQARLKQLNHDLKHADERSQALLIETSRLQQRLPGAPASDPRSPAADTPLVAEISLPTGSSPHAQITVLEPLNQRVNTLETSIAALEQIIEGKSSSDAPPSPPASLPEFDAQDDIETRLSKLEAYAQQINRRLDHLETRLERLETLAESDVSQTEPLSDTQQVSGRQLVHALRQASPLSFEYDRPFYVEWQADDDSPSELLRVDVQPAPSYKHVVVADATDPNTPVFTAQLHPDSSVVVTQNDLSARALHTLNNLPVAEPARPVIRSRAQEMQQ